MPSSESFLEIANLIYDHEAYSYSPVGWWLLLWFISEFVASLCDMIYNENNNYNNKLFISNRQCVLIELKILFFIKITTLLLAAIYRVSDMKLRRMKRREGEKICFRRTCTLSIKLDFPFPLSFFVCQLIYFLSTISPILVNRWPSV